MSYLLSVNEYTTSPITTVDNTRKYNFLRHDTRANTCFAPVKKNGNTSTAIILEYDSLGTLLNTISVNTSTIQNYDIQHSCIDYVGNFIYLVLAPYNATPANFRIAKYSFTYNTGTKTNSAYTFVSLSSNLGSASSQARCIEYNSNFNYIYVCDAGTGVINIVSTALANVGSPISTSSRYSLFFNPANNTIIAPSDSATNLQIFSVTGSGLTITLTGTISLSGMPSGINGGRFINYDNDSGFLYYSTFTSVARSDGYLVFLDASLNANTGINIKIPKITDSLGFLSGIHSVNCVKFNNSNTIFVSLLEWLGASDSYLGSFNLIKK